MSVPTLLHGARAGDYGAVKALFESSYDELRKIARARLRPGGSAGLATTELVHECFLRFVKRDGLRLEDRPHFFRYASRAMRSVIVDIARRPAAAREHITITTGAAGSTGVEEILRIHGALDDLAKVDTRMVEVVEMRYFAGMTELEIAEALGITDRTVRRIWEKARLFLAGALNGDV
ncbi:MAG: sigma-70 family RNA polymerase sigma factor [Acidobacteria bacterium]|nr:sigma-70 family RNA polymerase sigma factor [Acidobacteriota bacterium]